MARKRSSRRPVKKTTRKKATKRKTTAKRKPVARKKPAKGKPARKEPRGLVAKEIPVAGSSAGEPASVYIAGGTIPPPAP